jgi:hypothetical protein
MKKWGVLVVLFYIFSLVVLTFPVCKACFWGQTPPYGDELSSIVRYWPVFVIMGVGQLLLLFVPVQIAERRLKSRRSLLIPVLTSAFMFMILSSAVVLSLVFAIWGDVGPFPYGSVASKIINNGYTWIVLMLSAWFFWFVVFYRFSKNVEPDAFIRRFTSWLLRGSILELLIAVPSHIIVRRREDCCAPIVTFWGIAAGIAIMLLSFGPGVFYLFVEKCKRSQRANRPGCVT